MQIRKATQNDTRELIKLFIKFNNYARRYSSALLIKIRAYKDIKRAAEEQIKEYLSKPDNIAFVADDNGILKGYITGEIKEKKHRVFNKEGYIANWFVEEDFQNKGIGRQLFKKLLEEFRKANCTHVQLDTRVENKRATATYEKMGFTKTLIVFFKSLKDLP